ncbi:restriction endonuclease subunit S [Chitinophaga polysaccharea]|uniref:restriction endonuclease subunit S n=1 Tax=Chitinophaga polysaccharea TaxID=1293035 RepID=UPI00145555C2|nr:restriction endonuclease subunit S [Chitinophaga polysaccharea]NLR59386.1 restriction endonuclease subunit S [Chitinophaga polysaccharea]
MSQELNWIQTLPNGWIAIPLKAIANYFVSNVDKVSKEEEIPVELCNYTDVYKNDFITTQLEFMQSSATEEEIRKFQLAVGDVVITKDSESWDDIAIPALVAETKENLLCGYHLAIIRSNLNKVVPEYLFRCIEAKVIRVQLELSSTGVTRFGLPKDEIGRLKLPIPDIFVQRKVVSFLKSEISYIDRLITQKEKLINILAEKRQAFITQVVIRGLDSSIKLKDSTIYWLGKVPEHWEIKKIKYITSKIGSGVTPKGGATVYLDEGIPLLRSQNIHFDGLRLEDVAFISEETHNEMSNSKVRAGDVLLNITGASIGRCYFYEGQLGEANVNQHVCILRPNRKVHTKYLYLLMTSTIGQSQIDLNQVGGGREGLTFDSLKSFTVSLPPISEQMEIINVVEKHNSKFNEIEVATRKTVDLLRERRVALISAAVTGQIEIQ